MFMLRYTLVTLQYVLGHGMEAHSFDRNPWESDPLEIAPLKQALGLAQRTGHVRWVSLFQLQFLKIV